MPEGYAHVRTARRAAELAGAVIDSQAALALGANGPDPLFFYQSWLPGAQRRPNLYPLAERMHIEHTGAFLLQLLQRAGTRVQWDYARGFLCHYALDTTVHPFVAAVEQPGQVYCRTQGHGFFEIGLDSYLYRKDHGTGAIPGTASTPELPEGELLQIGGLLNRCLASIYDEEISTDFLCASFAHMRGVRQMLCDPALPVRGLVQAAEKLLGEGTVSCHITPAPLDGLEGDVLLPCPWTDPYTGREVQQGLFELLDIAAEKGARLIRAADGWKAGSLSPEALAAEIGNENYATGVPNAPEPAPQSE